MNWLKMKIGTKIKAKEEQKARAKKKERENVIKLMKKRNVKVILLLKEGYYLKRIRTLTAMLHSHQTRQTKNCLRMKE